uniref:PSP1 C-terminal domain-containing protein n=1 Tax=candidate division WOR-3 bacterium TaxID=2052148 RepID=A0A7V3RG75_UNCW3
MKYRIEITPFWRILGCSESFYSIGDLVLFKSKDGIDVGKIIDIPDEEGETVEILRSLHNDDFLKMEELKEYEEFCLIEFKNAVREFNLDMKPVYAHCQFDEERVIFYFTADKKMKFRKLHRYISQKLNRRVVIKQIGARDYARYMGGVGPCGRKICCAAFLKNLKSISLRMARMQNIFLSPNKLSGICGKLLCCLNFEEDFYADFQNINSFIKSEGEEEEELEEY